MSEKEKIQKELQWLQVKMQKLEGFLLDATGDVLKIKKEIAEMLDFLE